MAKKRRSVKSVRRRRRGRRAVVGSLAGAAALAALAGGANRLRTARAVRGPATVPYTVPLTVPVTSDREVMEIRSRDKLANRQKRYKRMRDASEGLHEAAADARRWHSRRKKSSRRKLPV